MRSVQHKLLNHEVIPPERSWKKIAEELDDAGAGFQFPHTLRNMAVTTLPEGLWEKIAAELDDAGSGLQFPAKLKELSLPAPAAVWDKIGHWLDEEAETGSAAKKLAGAEVLPPATAWDRIESSLDKKQEEKAPANRKPAFRKYAAAAAIIGFLSFGVSLLIDQGNTGTPTASGDRTKPLIEALSHATAGVEAATDDGDNTTNTSAEEQQAREDAALEASKKTYARLNIPPAKRARIAAAFRFDTYLNPDDINSHGSSGYEEALDRSEKQADRYIVLMTPEGHFIRVSKKLSGLVCCVSGEDQDKECLSKVEAWRKQLACSDAAHPGNFMDILNLVNSLQDK